MIRNFNQKGFTLLEFIVTLVLVAIVGTMVVSFMGTPVTQSGRSVTWMKEEFELSQAMERMLADYREALNDAALNDENFDSTDLEAFITDRNTTSKINNLYDGSSLDSAVATRTAFTEDNPGNPSTDYTEGGIGDPTIWKVTLRKGDQTLVTLFTSDP
ncbi:MAG: type II secretion system protein [Syntrophales bacterium]|nr:type II secretion system protein [Syntrophales bacterium]